MGKKECILVAAILDKRGHQRYTFPMNHKPALALKTIPAFDILEKSYPGLRAVFFDMDGTLFDTEKYHTEAMFMIGRKYNIVPPHGPKEVHAMMHGKADYLVFDIIKSWDGFPPDWTVEKFVATKNENLFQILSSLDPREYYPEATAKLLQDIRAAGKFIALVTSSERVVTVELLKLVGLLDFFDVVVTRDDCPKHKPDPWPYVETMKHAGSDENSTLIFEDSNVGLIAAHASKAHVIKVEWF